MSTKVYGHSDDCVEVEGDVDGEVAYPRKTTQTYQGVLLAFSDGTFLEVKYHKAGIAVWGITVVKKGSLFDHIDYCTDEDDVNPSDVAYFKDGLQWAYAAWDWDRVK